MPIVPERYRGLWRRRLLETPGHSDRSTTVYWLQTGSLYADLRIPADRDRDDPHSLARQQGFAGRLVVAADLLTWERWLDFQPPATPDVGRVHFEDAVLVEHGLHSDYREEWERVQAADADGVALSLEAELDARGRQVTRHGVLVATRGYFLFALDRPRPLPAAPDLGALLKRGTRTPDEQRALLDCAIDFGERSPDGTWRVRHSTRPAHEQHDLAGLHGAWRSDGPQRYLQSRAGGVFRRWRVVERGAAFRGLPGESP